MTAARRAIRAALRLYPRWWRDRYGTDAEVTAAGLVGDGRPLVSVIVNLLRGAVDATLHPQTAAIPAPLLRLGRSSATLTGVWVAVLPLLLVALVTVPLDAQRVTSFAGARPVGSLD